MTCDIMQTHGKPGRRALHAF